MSHVETDETGPLTGSVERLRQEFDRWLETAMSQGGRALNAIGLRSGGKWTPPVDVVETPDEVLVTVDLPGVAASAVGVTLAGNMLTLKGESASIDAPEDRRVHMTERCHGPFERSVPMPVPVEPESVSAEARDGVLTVRLPKAERAKTRQIPVSTGGGGEHGG